MVAQDLVVSKQPEAFHTHDIPSVHGSGAFGLALQSNTYELGLPRLSRLEPCSLSTRLVKMAAMGAARLCLWHESLVQHITSAHDYTLSITSGEKCRPRTGEPNYKQ